MKSCAVRQNAQTVREEASPFVSLASDLRDPVFCPRPRLMPRQQVEPWDPKPGAEVLDAILSRVVHSGGGGGQVASSPPYLCGSPPSTVANPLVLDAHFVEENAALPGPLPLPTVSAAASSSTGERKGCVRTKLGASPAAVRVEGFDCLDRGGRRSSSIAAVA